MIQQNSNIDKNPADEDEIDLIALAKTLWDGRKKILKITFVFMVIGLFVAIFSEKEFRAPITFVEQTSDSNIGGGLGGLAAMAGINLGGVGSESGISPDLYPQIISSIPFQKELLETQLTIEGFDEKITFKEYYTNVYNPSLLGYIKKYTIGLPRTIIKIFIGKSKEGNAINRTGSEIKVSAEEKELMDMFEDIVVLNVNDKEGYINLEVNMPEAIAAAQMTTSAQVLLEKYIIDFKIKKSKEQLRFLEDRYLEKEKVFKEIQNKLALYKDSNRNVNSSYIETKLRNYESEYELAFSVLNELGKNLEAQKIQVKEDTPVLAIINPVSIPLIKSAPKRGKILITWIMFGFIFSSILALLRKPYQELKEKWNEK